MTATEIIKPRGCHLIAKSNELVYRSYRLSVVEQRLVAILASRISPTDHDFSSYYFSYADLASLCGLQRGGSVVRDAKNAIAGLRGRTLRLPCVDAAGNPAEMMVGWISASICSNHFDGGVTLRLEPELKPYFLALRERFVSYGLHNIVQMKTMFGIRFYEVFKGRQRLGKMRLSLDEARKIAGLSDTEHERPTDFRRKVLTPAVADINGRTDIRVKLKRILQSRALVGWQVSIRAQEPKGFDRSAPPPVPVEVPPPLTESEAERHERLYQLFVSGQKLSPDEDADFSFLESKKERHETFIESAPNQSSLF